MKNKNNKFTKVSFILLILGLGIGILLTVQFKVPVTRVSNPITPYISLQDTRDSLVLQQEELKDQIKILQSEITDKQEDLKRFTNSKQKIEEIENYKYRIGLTEVEGEGVEIIFDDANHDQITTDSITHAADLRDLVNFLWSIGSEAISINNERIVFTTSIDCIVNTILINSTKTVPPFKIKAIGSPMYLSAQLKNQDNLKDIKKRVDDQGLVFDINQAGNVVIPAYSGSFVLENISIKE